MYSSSGLNGPSESGCWKQLDYSEANADSLFGLEYRSSVGIAAHAVLQYCLERRTETEADIRKTAEEVGTLLIREGRSFRGRHEPPLPADDVLLGVDLAVRYIMARGLPLGADVILPEQDWIHPSLPYQALIDLVTVQDEGDEEYSIRVCEVADDKSSWQAKDGELGTLQRWGQAVCVWRNMAKIGEVDIIRQRVINLRTWGEWTRDIHLNDPDAEFTVSDLERWEERIGMLCNTAHLVQTHEGGGGRPANPGAGCLSCPYRHICKDAWTVGDIPIMGLEALATELATVEGRRSLLIKAIKEADPESLIHIHGGSVGFKEQLTRVLKEGKERDILDEWLERLACDLPEADMPVLVSLLAALKLGKGNLDALAKAIMPERKRGIVAVRAEYVESLTVEKRGSKFGVWKDD